MIDRETGNVERVVAIHDVGKAVNPVLCEGQIEGSVHMGLGYALTEDFPSDPATGFPTNMTLRSLGILRAKDVPPIEVHLVEVPQPKSPYGIKGVGEIGLVPDRAGGRRGTARLRRRVAHVVADATQVRRRRLTAQTGLAETRRRSGVFENGAEPGLGGRHVEQRGGLGETGIVGAERGEDRGVFGDGSLGRSGLDHASPRSTTGRAARHAVQHRRQGCVAAGSGDEVMELLVELHQLLVGRGERHLM